jgi:hypothetical protein
LFDEFILRTVSVASGGRGEERGCSSYVWLFLAFTACSFLILSYTPCTGLSLSFSLFLFVFRVLCFLDLVVSPRPLLLLLRFFFLFSLNIGHSVDLLDCGTVLTQGVYLHKTTEESRAQVDPSIVVFSHRPDRLKVVCKSWWHVAFTLKISATGLPWQVDSLLNRNAAQCKYSRHAIRNYVPDMHCIGNLIAQFNPYVCKINYNHYLN